jgi:hypothetical protein
MKRAIIGLVLFLPTLAVAQQGDAAMLRGRRSFHVTVENLDANAQQCGVSGSQIQTDVELRLRRSGVTVVDRTSSSDALYVNLNVVHTPFGCIYAVQVEFNQFMFREVDVIAALPGSPSPTLSALCTTWSVGTLGTTPDLGGRRIRDSIGDQVDIFLNAWLSVNPPKQLSPGR